MPCRGHGAFLLSALPLGSVSGGGSSAKRSGHTTFAREFIPHEHKAGGSCLPGRQQCCLSWCGLSSRRDDGKPRQRGGLQGGRGEALLCKSYSGSELHPRLQPSECHMLARCTHSSGVSIQLPAHPVAFLTLTQGSRSSPEAEQPAGGRSATPARQGGEIRQQHRGMKATGWVHPERGRGWV